MGATSNVVTMVKRSRCIECEFGFKRASVAGKLQS